MKVMTYNCQNLIVGKKRIYMVHLNRKFQAVLRSLQETVENYQHFLKSVMGTFTQFSERQKLVLPCSCWMENYVSILRMLLYMI